VVLFEVLGELLVWWGGENIFLPEVWGEEGVSRADSLESGLGEVSKGGGGAASRGVAIFKTSHLHKLLGDWTTNETSSSGSGDESYVDGTAFAVDLGRNGVRFTKLVTPVTSSDWDNRELGKNDSATDSGGDFLGALDSKTDVTVSVTNADDSLESGSLTGSGLLLDGLDLQDFVLEGGADEVINDLELLDGKGEVVDFFNGLDLAVLDKSTELGNGLPFLWLGLASTSSTASTASSATTTETTSETTTGCLGWSCVRHKVLFESVRQSKSDSKMG